MSTTEKTIRIRIFGYNARVNRVHSKLRNVAVKASVEFGENAKRETPVCE